MADPLFTKLTFRSDMTSIGVATLQIGSQVHVGSGKKLVATVTDLRDVVEQVIRGLEAERRALGATADHAGGVINDAALLAALKEANELRRTVAFDRRQGFTEIIVRAAGNLCDGELVAAILGVKLEEGSRLLEAAVKGVHG